MNTYLHRRSRVVWVFPVLGLIVGGGCKCGPGTTLAPDGQNLGPYLDVLGAVCGYLSRCPDGSPFPIAYRSQSECVSILEFLTSCQLKVSDDSSGNIQFGVAQAFPSVDAAQAKACIDWLNQAACGAPFTCGDAGCDSPCAFLGGGRDGGSTAALQPGLDQPCPNYACAPGFYCESPRAVDGGTTCQVCKPLRGLGEDCTDPPYVNCAPGLFCSSDGGGCVAALSAGTGCSWGDQCASTFCNPRTNQCDSAGLPGDSCTTVQDCRQGFCDGTGHCQNLVANGAACTANSQCQAGFCDTGSQKCGGPNGVTCSSSSQCQGYCDTSSGVCASKLANGASCNDGSECQSGWCDYFGTRSCIPDGCHSDADCAAGHYCDSSSERCVPVGAAGAGCEQNSQCQSNFCNSSRVCATKPGLGGACTGYADCLPVGYCANGTCTAFLKPDQACTDLESCAPPFICQKGKCTLMPLTCAPAPTGSTCTYLQVCDQNSYCNPIDSFTCDARAGAGGPCNGRPQQCQVGLHCDLPSRSCAPDGQAGASCGFEAPCAAGFFCDSSTSKCSAPLPDGAACSPSQPSSQCQSGNCASGGSGYVCIAACIPPPPGEVPACHPAKQCPAGQLCGTFDDGCGSQLDCGTCSAPQSCGGGGAAGVCGCTPSNTCLPRQCTPIDNGCGQQITCSPTCPTAQSCGGGGVSGLCGCVTDTTTPPAAPATAADVFQDGGSYMSQWWTPQNAGAGADSGVVASVQIDDIRGCDLLVASGFGLQIPASATVNQIQVSLQVGVADPFGNYASASFARVVLMSGGKVLETMKNPPTYVSGNLQTVTLTLGAYPWQPAQLNAADFSVGFTFSTAFSATVVSVNDVRVSVAYDHDCTACHPLCYPSWQCGDDGCGHPCNGGCAAGWSCQFNTCFPPLWTDPTSGLTWQNTVYPSFAACQASDAGGFTDWHAPTIDQMRSLVQGCPATQLDGGCGVTSACTTATCDNAACTGCPLSAGPGFNGAYLPSQFSPAFTRPSGGSYLTSTTPSPNGYWEMFYDQAAVIEGSAQDNACVRP